MTAWALKNKIWDEFIYGGYLVGINNALILLMAIIIANKFDHFGSLIFISFLMVTIIYKANHLKEVNSDLLSNPERSEFVIRSKNKELIIVIVFSLALSLVAYFISATIFLVSIFLLILGLVYPKNITKKILGFKDFYVALVWSLIIFLPYFLFPGTNILTYLLLYVFIFMKSFINVTFSDLKDVDEDRAENLKTYPVILGEQKTIKMLNIINILSLIPLGLGIIYKILPLYSSLLIISILYTYFYLRIDPSDKGQLRKKSYILVDGEAIIWVILLIIGKLLIG